MQNKFLALTTFMTTFCLFIFVFGSRVDTPPLNSSFNTSKGNSLEEEIFILFPGTYDFQLTFEQNTPESRTALDSLLGEFGCGNLGEDPCGPFKPYQILWNFSQDNRVLYNETASHKVSEGGGYTFDLREEGIKTVDLPFGHLSFKAKMMSDFSEANPYNPHFKLRPGSTFFMFQSSLATTLHYLYHFGLFLFVPFTFVLLLITMGFYLKTHSK